MRVLSVASLLIAACALACAQAGAGAGSAASPSSVIFSDDFSQTELGAFPDHWTLKGPGAGGNPLSVVERDGARFLLSQTPLVEDDQQTASTLYARLPKQNDMPAVFTIEFDAVFGYSRLVNDLQSEKQYGVLAGSADSSSTLLAVTSQRAFTRNAQANLNLAVGKVHHVALTVDGRSVHATVDGAEVIADPGGAERPITRIGLELSSLKAAPQDDLMFTNFRIVEGQRP
jgi:hypothetical protein